MYEKSSVMVYVRLQLVKEFLRIRDVKIIIRSEYVFIELKRTVCSATDERL